MGAAVVVNNPSQAVKDICKMRTSGQCLLKDRLEKTNQRVTVFSGLETGDGGTEHIQVCDSRFAR